MNLIWNSAITLRNYGVSIHYSEKRVRAALHRFLCSSNSSDRLIDLIKSFSFDCTSDANRIGSLPARFSASAVGIPTLFRILSSKEVSSMKQHFHFLRILLLAIALLFGVTTIASAQEITGSIVGTVKDANGAVVKGATVTITNSDTKLAVRTVTTNDDGEFSAPLLPVAFYDITVEAPNFKKHVDERVKLDVNARRTVDVSLQAGNVSEVVTVTSGVQQ